MRLRREGALARRARGGGLLSNSIDIGCPVPILTISICFTQTTAPWTNGSARRTFAELAIEVRKRGLGLGSRFVEDDGDACRPAAAVILCKRKGERVGKRFSSQADAGIRRLSYPD